MSEFQWWLLIAGLVVGGTVVALLTLRIPRDDGDLAGDEQVAEAAFIAGHLSAEGRRVDAATVARVLEAHREYLALPVPDAIVPAVGEASAQGKASAADRYPDRAPDQVGDRGRGGPDQDLPTT